MRFVTFAQRFVNVFAQVQIDAVVVMAHARKQLRHLLLALLDTPNRLEGRTPSKRSSRASIESMGGSGIGWRQSMKPAYASARCPAIAGRGR
jgi:hypothetical protein